jgi:hypothetical protein
MSKESIKLDDFVREAAKALDMDDSPLTPETQVRHICSDCGRGYNHSDLYCTKDGAKVVEEKYEVKSDEYADFVYDVISAAGSEDCSEDFPYEYVDEIEKRGDGSGYYMNFIFKRKSDGKFFYYTSYDGRIEENTLDETKKEVKVTWDFERYFS